MKTVGNRTSTRLEVGLRVLAAIPGNYALTSILTALLARVLPGPAVQASLGATMLSFAIFATIALTAFAVRSVARLWIGMAGLAVVAGGLAWLLIATGGRL